MMMRVKAPETLDGQYQTANRTQIATQSHSDMPRYQAPSLLHEAISESHHLAAEAAGECR